MVRRSRKERDGAYVILKDVQGVAALRQGERSTTDENNGNQTNVGLFVKPDDLRKLKSELHTKHDRISNELSTQPDLRPLRLPVLWDRRQIWPDNSQCLLRSTLLTALNL
jgi:hypothetical protein